MRAELSVDKATEDGGLEISFTVEQRDLSLLAAFQALPSLMIFFAQECVCDSVMGSRWEAARVRRARKMGADLAARLTPLCFMGEGLPHRGNAIRDNCSEEAQPPETDHQAARRMDLGIRR